MRARQSRSRQPARPNESMAKKEATVSAEVKQQDRFGARALK
jgi:hypothetical protein